MDFAKKQVVLRSVQKRFIYTADQGGFPDNWKVTTDAESDIRDDCDGHALTLLWELSGRSWVRFWWLQVTFQAVIWHVKSYRGGNHAVLWYKGHWADNMEHDFYETKDMRHSRRYPYYAPLVALKMLVTKIFSW